MNVFLLRVILTILIGSFWYEAKRIFELEKKEDGANIYVLLYNAFDFGAVFYLAFDVKGE